MFVVFDGLRVLKFYMFNLVNFVDFDNCKSFEAF